MSFSDDCLTCNGRGWVHVKIEPRTVETCPGCLGAYNNEITSRTETKTSGQETEGCTTCETVWPRPDDSGSG